MQTGLTLQSSKYGVDKVIFDADDKTGQVEVSTRDYERTPNLYGYMTGTIRPTRNLYLNMSATYTGSMLVPHEPYTDMPSSIKPNAGGLFDGVVDGQRYRGVAEGKAYLAKTPSFFDLDLKLGYDIALSQTAKLNLNIGVQNIFGAYQKDTDMGPGRASTYVYGPTLPRRYFASASISF